VSSSLEKKVKIEEPTNGKMVDIKCHKKKMHGSKDAQKKIEGSEREIRSENRATRPSHAHHP
jgi:hypothetical protein